MFILVLVVFIFAFTQCEVYNISPMGLILLPWLPNPLGISTYPLGLLLIWVYYVCGINSWEFGS